ncbi:MAG: class I SAM-dependent methyltransferase [Armatimonadetes bacterium]|nr:class I SAM-dependent methyltransferase [Armatimonadota bacterium]
MGGEVSDKDRFAFGRNWQRFLEVLDDNRTRIAEESIKDMLGGDTLAGRTFLDVGSGSGLFSLAAKRLGARVHSFDYDSQSVACTRELKRRYLPEDIEWQIERGSVLDAEYMRSLGRFDVVYAWGVLHHSGDMWRALDNVAPSVAEGGKLFISIYNDQGRASRRWAFIKRLYNRLPRPFGFPLEVYTLIRQWSLTFVRDLFKGDPLGSWREYRRDRGMSPWRDIVDWVGGYPFEIAKPEEIFEFYHRRGFVLERLKTCAGGIGCNEFVFIRPVISDD